jgi:hydroxymethylbilane synthase
MKITIGSRGSALALWQANWVREQLTRAGHDVEIRIIRTSGDRLPQAPLTQSGIKGLFIKEIEEAVVAGEIDGAVHSLKDLPAGLPPGLTIAAVPARADARDALVSRDGASFRALPPAARVGTSSVRRQSQLRHLRPDLEMIPMRGNVDTRLRKLERGECEALVMAAAGLARLGLESRISERFPPSEVCPAVGQGALAIEIRDDDEPMARAVGALDDAGTHCAVRAERALLRQLGGGCAVPIAGHAVLANGLLSLDGVVARPDGSRLIRASASGAMGAPEDLGRRLADDLFRRGAAEILEAS